MFRPTSLHSAVVFTLFHSSLLPDHIPQSTLPCQQILQLPSPLFSISYLLQITFSLPLLTFLPAELIV